MRLTPLPIQFRQKIPQGTSFFNLTGTLKKERLHTVCEEAHCPNRTDCYARGTLTFQILGDICTRRCGFCAETTGRPGAVDLTEPERILRAVQDLQLKHVVLTAPARDDLDDGGASVFAQTVSLLKAYLNDVTVEILISDLQGNRKALQTVLDSGPDVFNHNIETVARLTPKVRAKATYERSLEVLKFVSEYDLNRALGLKVKSGLIVGLGESLIEIFQTLADIKQAGVQYLTVGQYLQPSFKHLPIEKFYSDEEFKELQMAAESCGFEKVFCGPLVRSSYHADEMV